MVGGFECFVMVNQDARDLCLFIFVFKKTNELSKEEIEQLVKLHNETMSKERTVIEFKEKYLYNHKKIHIGKIVPKILI